MYLKSIGGRCFKGAISFEFSLSRANVIVGDNFIGKTRITDAIRLLLLGFLPELGNTARATFQLASGPTMEVWGELTDGTTTLKIRRGWSLSGNSVKATSEIPPEISGCNVLTVMLNAEEYFALSERDRVSYVFKHCPGHAGGINLKSIRPRLLKAAKNWTAEKCVHEVETAIPAAESVQEEIDGAIAATADCWKSAKDHAKRMEETVRGLLALRAGDTDQLRPLPGLQTAVEEIRAHISRLTEERGKILEQNAAFGRWKIRQEDLRRQLSGLAKDQERRAQLDEKLALAQERLEALPVGNRAELERIDAELGKISEGIALLVADEKRLSAEIQTLEKELRGIDEQEHCPYCGAAGLGWKNLRMGDLAAKIDALKMDVANKTPAAAELRDRLEPLRNNRKIEAEILTVRAELDALVNGIVREMDQIAPRIAKAAALTEELHAPSTLALVPQEKLEAVQQEINVRNEEIRRLEKEITAVNNRAAEEQRIATAEKQRDEAKEEVEAYAGIGKELRQIQAEMVEASFRPLLQTANEIFGGILRSPITYRDGEIGTTRNGVWYSHKIFSGVEKALTYAAIQAALAKSSPVKLMLLDELGRLNTKNASKLADAILDVLDKHDGPIDQFVGIDPEREALYKTKTLGRGYTIMRIE